MPNQFFKLPASEQAALIKKAADQFEIPEIIIEKDIWICWLLEKIFSLPMQMAFKGGTSLSKVFNLIKRFSEDCDITIDYHNFKPDLDLENTSRSQLKKVSAQLKEQLQSYISEIVLPFLKSELDKSLPMDLFNITLSDDGEQLRFYYPSVVNAAFLTTQNGYLTTENGKYLVAEKNDNKDYLKDHVFIEFGVRNSTEPCKKYPLKTYLADVVTTDLGLPKPIVNTLSPIRTFFEKATLIHVECHRDSTKPTPDRFSRHWYDLYILNNSFFGKEALSNFEILRSVVEHKKAFWNYSFVSYDDCISGKLRLIPNQNYLNGLEKDYKQMINAGMFNETPPLFSDIIKYLSKLEDEINKKIKNG